MSLTNSYTASGYLDPWGNIRSGFRAGLSPLIFPILLFDLYKKIDINITPSISGGTPNVFVFLGDIIVVFLWVFCLPTWWVGFLIA